MRDNQKIVNVFTEKRQEEKFVLGCFSVYNRTRPIKQIGGHNRFVELNGFILWPCPSVVIHFLLDKPAGPHRKRTVKSLPHQDTTEQEKRVITPI